MIEAVNAVIANAPLLRQNAEQNGGGALSASNTAPESVRAVAQAPYISPFVSVDVNFDTAVILLRDSETGDTVQQIPSEGALEARRREQVAEQSSAKLEAAIQQTERGDISLADNSFIEASTPVKSTPAPSQSAPAPQTSAPAPTPISQAALSAFASGASTASATSSSFETSA